MLICGEKVRLTLNERTQLGALVMQDPGYIRSRDELEDYIGFHLERLRHQDTPTSEFTRRLLESFLPGPTKKGCAACPAVNCTKRRA